MCGAGTNALKPLFGLVSRLMAFQSMITIKRPMSCHVFVWRRDKSIIKRKTLCSHNGYDGVVVGLIGVAVSFSSTITSAVEAWNW